MLTAPRFLPKPPFYSSAPLRVVLPGAQINPFPERKTAPAPINLWSHLPTDGAAGDFGNAPVQKVVLGWLGIESRPPRKGPDAIASSLLSNYFCICALKMKLLKPMRVTGHEK